MKAELRTLKMTELRKNRRRLWTIGWLAPGMTAVLAATSVWAQGGVLEINQACAVNTGCFPGDTAGFPVTITSSSPAHSFRLTSDLDVDQDNTPGVAIQTDHVTLDLGGFEIKGVSECMDVGAQLSCSGTGTDGYGVKFAQGLDPSASVIGPAVLNGSVHNMTFKGIGGNGIGARIEDITAYNNRGDGIHTDEDSIVSHSIARENAGDGFNLGQGSVINGCTAEGNAINGVEIRGPAAAADLCVSRGNGASGFVLAHSSRFANNISLDNQDPDDCGGGICTTRRRYFLTADPFLPTSAPSACPNGFHFASFLELADQGTMVYDGQIGYADAPDQGEGPPLYNFAAGWVGWARTGTPSGWESGIAANCRVWTSVNPTEVGGVWGFWGDSATADVGYLNRNDAQCSTPQRVWCVED